MKNSIVALMVMAIMGIGAPVPAAEGMSGHGGSHQNTGNSGHAADMQAAPMGFVHQETSQGVDAEFQIMDLAGMNMKDEKGATHHVMVKLMDTATHESITQAVGKIKIIGPDDQEQISDLKDYGGILAANVTFDAPGKYGVICLFKEQDRKHLIKFWYPHQK